VAPCLLASISGSMPRLQERVGAVERAETMDELVETVTVLVRELGVQVVQTVLAEWAAEPTAWPLCPDCGSRLRSKGWRNRQLGTSLGRVCWRRRVGRCPRGCRINQVAPLDARLGLAAYQGHSSELMRKATLLAVFVPLATARSILTRLSGVTVATTTVWEWVQVAGRRAAAKLQAELEHCAAGQAVAREPMAEMIDQLLMLLGADGVMVPFRPKGGSPKGAAVWREVKVGVITRLEAGLNRAGRPVTKLRQRRLVAVLGDIDALAQRLQLEALRQGLTSATRAVWISDGARGLWRVYRECLAPYGVVGILDFYHTVGQLWTAAEPWFHWLPSAQAWLQQARHGLRHGGAAELMTCLQAEADRCHRSAADRHVLARVANYLRTHLSHLDYPTFKSQGLPIGSGFVESAVKWLIQQRFKGVGMRWSEDGFNHLLMLRLAWANDRFDPLFTPSPNS
jgi:hypothetical protein